MFFIPSKLKHAVSPKKEPTNLPLNLEPKACAASSITLNPFDNAIL